MPPSLDLAGRTFGSLRVIRRAGSKNGKAAWACQCKCGRKPIVRASDLVRGKTTTCGRKPCKVIPGGNTRGKLIKWTVEHVALLGTDTDERIAARIGATKSQVGGQRRRLGIKIYENPRPCVDCGDRITGHGLAIRCEVCRRRESVLQVKKIKQRRQIKEAAETLGKLSKRTQ